MKYDSIIVGGGIAGIVVATRLATMGKKVMLLEKQEIPGGYFSGFQNEAGDKFDYAISYVLSCGEDDVVTDYLKEIGMEQEIQFHKLKKTDDIYIADRHITFSDGREEFKNTLYQEFPDSKQEIDSLMEWLIDYQDGVAVQGSKAMMFFMKNFKRDYEEFLDSQITDSLLKCVLSLRIQADPASLMIMAGFVVECYFKGMYYPVGGSLRMVQKLIDDFIKKGGVLKTGEEINSFECVDKQVKAVTSVSGNRYEAETFVFNGDVIKLNKEFLGDFKDEAKIEKLSKRVVGHSSLSIYLTVKDYDLSRFEGGRVYVTESTNIFDTYREVEADMIPEKGVIKLHFPCTYDNTLTDSDKQLIRIETDIFYDEEKDTEEKYQAYAEQILQYVEDKLLKDLSKSIVYKRVITPVEFSNMFGHTHGSGTGWAHTTHNTMVAKYTQTTSMKNLFIAGQWGEFGSGLRQLVLSGEKTVGLVCKALERCEGK